MTNNHYIVMTVYFIHLFIAVHKCAKCALSLYEDSNLQGNKWGPFDIGTITMQSFSNDAVSSATLTAEDYPCNAVFYADDYYGNGNCENQMSGSTLYSNPHTTQQINSFSVDNSLSCVVLHVITPSPSINPTNIPTNIPTESPTIIPSLLPTQNPTLLPTKHPTYPPTKNPTFELSCIIDDYCTISECNKLALYLTITSDRNILYRNVNSNSSNFSSIIKTNIVNHVCYAHKNRVSKIITVNYANNTLRNISANSLTISYEILGCIDNVCDYGLYNYLNSSQFTTYLSRDINDNYPNSNSKVLASVYVMPQPYSIHDIISQFSIHNPVSLILIIIFTLIWFILLIGFFHSTYPNICLFTVLGCTMIDNFKINRVTPFLFSTFTICNHLNTTYAYFFAFSIHETDVIFLIAGLLSFIIIVTKVLLNGIMVQSMENEVNYDKTHNYVAIWLESYKSKLIWAIVVSGSFNSSLWMVNSNLFGLKLFSMHLPYKKLIQYRLNSYNVKILLLTFCLLIISLFMLVYIHIKKYQESTIQWLTIICSLCCSSNLIQKLLMKYSSRNNNEYNYKTTRMNITIDVDTIDKNTIQKQKYLRTNIKKTISEILETNERNIDIVNSRNTLKGIYISFVVYHKIYGNKISHNRYKKISNEFIGNNYEPLIDFKTTMDETWYIEKKLSGHSIKNEIKQIYSLSKMPLNVSCEIYKEQINEKQDTKYTFEQCNSK